MARSVPVAAKKIKTPILLNSAEMEVIRALRRQGSISRTEVSNITSWSRAKATQEIRSLITKGYLVERGEGVSKGGRKPRLLFINHELGYIAGIDIGATSIDMALADVSGKVLQRRSEPTDVRLAPEVVLGRCAEVLCEMALAQGCRPEQVLGIGVGVPGPVDFARGVLVAPPLMPDWENFLIRDFLRKTFTTAFVAVDNDVNIMALGEQRYGSGINADHFIFVKVGTGIGAGILSNGKIHHTDGPFPEDLLIIMRLSKRRQ